jgi:hypothetical protein
MTDVDLSGVRGPVIGRDEHSAPFFDAAQRGELLIRRCPACGRWFGPDARTCTDCTGCELVWQPAAGTAALVTWAVVHSAPHGIFSDQLPYVTAYVELTEGPWLSARIVGNAPGELRAGAGLTVTFISADEGESYPVFRLTPPGAATP